MDTHLQLTATNDTGHTIENIHVDHMDVSARRLTIIALLSVGINHVLSVSLPTPRSWCVLIVPCDFARA